MHDITLAVAPMEGIMEHTMRNLLSGIGGMDYFVAEFVRVTQYPIPAQSFRRLVPESNNQSKTQHNHSVHIQLLGSSPELMAISAQNAVTAGATHIDINFGCPTKRVNGHGGGSVLLQEPQLIYDIINAIRTKLPLNIPLSAKIRLGYEDEHFLFDNVAAIEDAGASKLVIHGRTKKDGYQPPARWEKIAKINAMSKMNIVANGDIKDRQSLLLCQAMTGCNEFMIGRAALQNPFIFKELRSHLEKEQEQTEKQAINNHTQLHDLLFNYHQKLDKSYNDFARLGRLKQWCGHLRRHFPVIDTQLALLRHCKTTDDFFTTLNLQKPNDNNCQFDLSK